jgi:hypothetical protein
MSSRRALLAFFLCAAVVSGAELRIQKDGATQKITGDLVGLTEKQVVIKSGTEEITVPIDQVLTLDLKADDKLFPRNAKYSDVELTDGTLLHCKKVDIKGKEVELTTLAGQQIKVPLEEIGYVIGEAHEPKNVQTVQTQFLGGKRRSRDILLAKGADGQINGLPGTLGDADPKGETIAFTREGSNTKLQVPLARAAGMIFLRTPKADAAIPVCKLTDNHKNTVMVSTVALTPAGLTVSTPSGAKIEYPRELVAQLDFSKGKLTYLSDLTPAEVVETNNLDRVEHYRRNENLEGEKLTLAGTAYDKGLALHAYTALTYRLDGDYQFFSAVIGVDDNVGGSDGPTLVRLEGDGREIKTWTVARKDKPLTVRIPVRDVHRLKVVVSSGELLDLGKHVNLADAKLSKQ